MTVLDGALDPLGRRGVLLELGLDHLLRDGPDDLIDDLATLEEEQHRDRTAVEAGRRLDVGVDIHLGDLHSPLVLDRKLVEDRSDDAAGATPGRPEVDDGQAVMLLDLLTERRVGDRHSVLHARLPSPIWCATRAQRRRVAVSLSSLLEPASTTNSRPTPLDLEHASLTSASPCRASTRSSHSIAMCWEWMSFPWMMPMAPALRVWPPAMRWSSSSRPSGPIHPSASSSPKEAPAFTTCASSWMISMPRSTAAARPASVSSMRSPDSAPRASRSRSSIHPPRAACSSS